MDNRQRPEQASYYKKHEIAGAGCCLGSYYQKHESE